MNHSAKLNHTAMVMAMICGAFFSASSVGAAPRTKVPTYALLVGSTQPGKAQEPLQFAHDDVDRLRAVLIELGGIRPDDLVTLYDPSSAQLYRALTDIETRLDKHATVDEQALFLFYYSGHARSQSLNLGDDDVPLASLRTRLEQIPATVKLVILDACQTGAISRIKGVEPTALFSYNSVAGLNTAGMAVMSSSAANELSQESDQLEGSFFTHHLVVGLRGAADANSDGRITLNEAYQYSYNNTLVDTTGTAIGKQHVTLETELRGKGEMVLTWPAQAKSSIRLPADLSAEVLIFAEPENTVMAEIHKSAGNVLSLALPTGKYGALLRSSDATRYCEIGPRTGHLTELVLTSCREVTPNQIQFKGRQLVAGAANTHSRSGDDPPPVQSAPPTGASNPSIPGPQSFYVVVGGGVGYGLLKHEINVDSVSADLDPEGDGVSPPRGAIEEGSFAVQGNAWSGIPLRLAVGLFFVPRLSLEISGRFDVHRTVTKSPVSCWEKNGGTLVGIDKVSCNVELPVEGQNYTPAEQEAIARRSFALRQGSGTPEMRESSNFAWLVNARLRYQLLRRANLGASLFAGVGYGRVQYRVESVDGPYSVVPGMIDLELGMGIGYHFNTHFGIAVEVPLSVVVGDGLALNVDATVGFIVGF